MQKSSKQRSDCSIDRLQPRDKAAMLVVKTIKNFFAEFAW